MFVEADKEDFTSTEASHESSMGKTNAFEF